METEKIKKFLEDVDGFKSITNAEGKLLYDLAKNCNGEGVIVEIGSFKGKSAIWLSKGSKDGCNAKIFAIDPHPVLVYPDFKERYGEVWKLERINLQGGMTGYRGVWKLEEFKKSINHMKADDIIISVINTLNESVGDFDKTVELVFIPTSSEIRKKYGDEWSFGVFKKNTKDAEVDDVIIPIMKTSEEVAKDFAEPVELVFIDGGHDYDAVKRDFELWFPKVIEGGIMAFHDTMSTPGPNRVVEELVIKSNYFKNVKFVRTITFAEKVGQNSLKDRFRNRYVFLLKKLRDFTYRIHLLKHLPKPIIIVGEKLIRAVQ